MTRIKELHKKWIKDPEYRREYEALDEEYTLAAEVAKDPPPLRLEPDRAGAADEDGPEHDRTPRKRARQALDPHAP